MVTRTGKTGAPSGVVAPAPVPYSSTTDPLAAGFAIEFADPSSFEIEAWPRPESSTVSNAGAAGDTGSVTALPARPWNSTRIEVRVFPATASGTIAPIRLSDT